MSRTGFICGDRDIDKWFRNKALKDHGARKHLVTCANLTGEDNKLVGFYALSSAVEEAKKLPSVKFFPYLTDTHFSCIQLVCMAVRNDFQRQGYGSQILGQIVEDFVSVGKVVGVPALILTPANKDARRFYERIGFTSYDRNLRMVLSLNEAAAAVEAATAEIKSEDGL